jgi:hypothetical protein
MTPRPIIAHVYRWLDDFPVRSDYHARLAALIVAYMHDGMTAEAAWNYWLRKRPDFFTPDATPLMVDAPGSADARAFYKIGETNGNS